MLKWEINKKVLTSLIYEGKNIVKPWGVETADSSAFFSLEDGFGYRYKVLKENYHQTATTYSGTLVVKMQEGCWKLNFKDIIENNKVRRKITLECLEDSYFMDFVLRFRVRKEFVAYALINNLKIKHQNSNVYYQYPVEEVYLKGSGNFDIKVSIVSKSVPAKMTPLMYVRDLNDEWITHVRMLPNSYDKEVIKLCNSWYQTQPIPMWMSKLLLKFKVIRKNLWYRGEFSRFKSKIWRFINPAAFPMVHLKKGTILMWEADFEIIANTND